MPLNWIIRNGYNGTLYGCIFYDLTKEKKEEEKEGQRKRKIRYKETNF